MIADRFGPKAVLTLARAGIYAVHAEPTGDEDTRLFVVTHLPTGLKIETTRNRQVATLMAKHYQSIAGAVAPDGPWSTVPTGAAMELLQKARRQWDLASVAAAGVRCLFGPKPKRRK